ncbi:receptor-transporting protein 3-like [Hyperolius riggenbachi]|uniref:receptor-transporting protein 3-like n=1 Tax=Hyperolius riggenbachi TaxID=752182 RepID=UPI0035A26C2F
MANTSSGNIWIDVFCDLQKSELEERYQKTWVLQFNYSLEDSLTRGQRQNGWKIYQTSSYACFTCFQCGHFWNSGRVALIFHYCLGKSKKATVLLRIFGQQCRACENDRFIKPTFNEERAEKILEILILKIRKNCYGEDTGNNWHRPGRRMVRTKPHERDLCEACAAGVCNKEYDVV